MFALPVIPISRRIHNTLADAIQGRPYTDGGGGRGVDTPMRIAYERDFAFSREDLDATWGIDGTARGSIEH